MDSLINVLHQIEFLAEEPPDDVIDLGRHTFKPEDQEIGDILLTQATDLADTLLIAENGRCNWQNISILNNNKFNVHPLEQDRFGWLIGGIYTTKGVIVFG